MSDAGFALVAADALVSISKWTVNKAISFGNRSRIFLLGAAGEQEENGLGASASGPARTLTQNVPLGSRVVSQKVNFLGQGNKGGLISSAVRRRTGEYPPARLLLPGGLEPRSASEAPSFHVFGRAHPFDSAMENAQIRGGAEAARINGVNRLGSL